MPGSHRIVRGDCIEGMNSLPSNYYHAVVCDPPYALTKGGSSWDHVDVPAGIAPSNTGLDFKAGATGKAHSHGLATHRPEEFQEWCKGWAEAALRILRPGGHLLAFGSPRTYHRMVVGFEEAGFEIRDGLAWVYSHGYPKGIRDIGAKLPEWAGWGTTIRPAWEPIVLVRKPFKGSVANHVQKHGAGLVNIDGCKNEGKWPTNVLVNSEHDLKRYFYSFKATNEERWGWCRTCELAFVKTKQRTHAEHKIYWHPAVKPLGLIRWCIKLVVPPGGAVVDPFSGTGTVTVAARLEGAGESVSFERDLIFHQIAKTRVNQTPCTP